MTTDATNMLSTTGNTSASKPPPGYLVVRDRNGARIVPRDDTPAAIVPRRVDILPPGSRLTTAGCQRHREA